MYGDRLKKTEKTAMENVGIVHQLRAIVVNLPTEALWSKVRQRKMLVRLKCSKNLSNI